MLRRCAMPQNVDLTRPLEHLASQFERALPILFIGAGFSLAATTLDRKSTVPSVETLKKKLWQLCFADEEYSPSASLQNLYESALRLHRKNTTELLRGLLTVDSETLPDWYQQYFTMPWVRIYTLNIDDLLRAASRKFALPRDFHLISALRETYEPPQALINL